MVDRMADTVGWLTGWLVGWLTGWLVEWLTGWLVEWLAGWLAEWLTGRQVRLTSRLLIDDQSYVIETKPLGRLIP